MLPEVREFIDGVAVPDPYRWLEDLRRRCNDTSSLPVLFRRRETAPETPSASAAVGTGPGQGKYLVYFRIPR